MDVRWGELDVLGHINNVTYLRYFEEGRVRWLSDNGWGINDPHDDGPVVAHVGCSYRVPIHYPATLSILSRLTAVGKSSFTLQQSILVNSTLCTDAEFKCVWVDKNTGKAAPVPAWLRQLLPAS